MVGCGDIGALLESEPNRPKPATHAGALSSYSKTQLVALVDTDQKKLRAAGKLFPGARLYSSLEECLAEETPDIAAIAAPPDSHLALVTQCARSGVRMIICEKPVAYSLAHARAIAKIVREKKVAFVLNYQRRFFPVFESLRSDIRAGKLGTIEQVTCYYSNGVLNNGGHAIDSLNFLLGDKIASVLALENKHNRAAPAGDLNIDALLETQKGARIALQSLDQSKWGMHEFRIYGTKSAAVIGDYGYSLQKMLPVPGPFARVKTLESGDKITKQESMVAGALEHLIYCHERGAASQSDAESGQETLKILDAILESAEKKAMVTVRYK